METIGKSEIWSFFDESDQLRRASNDEIRKANGHPVRSFLDLAKKIAALQFSNPEHVLLYRGQSNDYQTVLKNGTKRYSSLKPTLFRPKIGAIGIAGEKLLSNRFTFLASAEQELVDLFSENTVFGGEDKKLRRQRILRWAILQHYEICVTPLLDVTQSLRVAASFATAKPTDQAFLYVLGVPNVSGAVTASAEAGLQIIRLSSVCPPVAVRPHIQEGFLLGEYPDMPDIMQKQNYASFEIDFSRRVIAKFCINPKKFWQNRNFPEIPHAALYPDNHDPLFELAKHLKASLGAQE